jgi:hypothetical protein
VTVLLSVKLARLKSAYRPANSFLAGSLKYKNKMLLLLVLVAVVVTFNRNIIAPTYTNIKVLPALLVPISASFLALTPQSAMAKMNLHDFVDSLKLPDHKASQLRASLEKDHEVISFLASREATSSTESSSALISPACLTLRIALEPEEVITGDDLTQVINSSWYESPLNLSLAKSPLGFQCWA